MRVFCTFAAAFLAHTSLAVAAMQYTAQSVGDFHPTSINIASQIIGPGPLGVPAYSELWTSGINTQLSPPGIPQPLGSTAINNVGQVAGWGFNTQSVEQGFFWDPSLGFVNLSVPAGQTTLLHAVNNLGQVGGRLRPTATWGPDIATIWTSAGSPVLLPSLGTGDSAVFGLNDLGQAVGTSGSPYDNYYPINPNAPYGQQHAVLWQNGSVTDLTPGDPWSSAQDINNLGQVVGYRFDFTTDGKSIPFLWDAVHGLVDLPGSAYNSYTSAINDEGQIVGYVGTDRSGASFAALWEDGALYNLNDLLPANSGWVLENANDINNLGQIVGDGLYNGQQEGFLLTPTTLSPSVPEPGTLALLLPVLLLRRRRR